VVYQKLVPVKLCAVFFVKIGEGDATNLGDTSTLLDPGVVEELSPVLKLKLNDSFIFHLILVSFETRMSFKLGHPRFKRGR